MKGKSILVLLSLAVLAFGASPGRAATFNVATQAEFAAALYQAGRNNQADTINVAAGTYNLTPATNPADSPLFYYPASTENHDLHQRWRYENREPLKADCYDMAHLKVGPTQSGLTDRSAGLPFLVS